MFQISNDHMQAFNNVALNNFQERAVRHLRTQFPNDSAPYSDQELRERVRRNMARSRTYGLTTERQIMCFVDTGMLVGEDFDSNRHLPWAPFILGDVKVSADDRAMAILHIAISMRHDEQKILAMVPPERRNSIFVNADLADEWEERNG